MKTHQIPGCDPSSHLCKVPSCKGWQWAQADWGEEKKTLKLEPIISMEEIRRNYPMEITRSKWFSNDSPENLPNAPGIIQEYWKEGKIIPNSFFEVNVIQIDKPDKDHAKKKIKDQYHQWVSM